MRSTPLILLLTITALPCLAGEDAPAAAAAADEAPATRTVVVAAIPLSLPDNLSGQAATLDQVLVDEINECNLFKVMAGVELQAALGAAGRGDLSACHVGHCLNEMLETLKVQRVVAGRIKKSGSGYSVEVELVGGPPGENRAELQWAGAEAELEHVLRAATQLAAVPRSWHEPAGLKLKDIPQGATVYIDGRAFDISDRGTIGPLSLGTHELLVEHPDFREWREPVVLGSGQLLEMPSGLEESRFYHEWWFWTTVVGAVAVAVIVPVAVVMSKGPEEGHKVPNGDLGKIQLGVVRW